MNTNKNISPLPQRTWPRRLLRFALWSLASVVTLYAVVFAAINWWGTRQLEQSEARVKAAGESLDFNALLPKPIDPATNFCAVEPLDGLRDATGTSLSPDPLGARRQALWEAGKRRKSKLTNPRLGDPIVGRLLSDTEFAPQWSAWFRDADATPLAPASGNDAATIRQGMEKAYPFLEMAAEAAAARKDAQFTPAMGANGPITNTAFMPMPHLNAALSLARTLELHLITCVQLRDGPAALADIQAMLRVAKAAAQEPTLISYLVGSTVFWFSGDQIWSCLEARIFSDAELATLQRELDELNVADNLLLTARAEIAGMHLTMRHFDVIGFSSDSLSRETRMSPKEMPGFIQFGFGILIPHGLLRWRLAQNLDDHLDRSIVPLRSGGLIALSRGLPKPTSNDSYDGNPIGMATGITSYGGMADASINVMQKAVFHETTRRQFLVACALERFYLQHQSYPEKLAELVPQHLAIVPTDLIDETPMRYRRIEDGRFILWSVGVDGKDDGGKIISPNSSRNQLSKSEFKGDWPWRYAPEGTAK